ncbi:hypothetical protein GCM10017044_28580 [Kordiimonas sediminis]|uniref:Intein C-terminal splicing domain-containing protein n=2 Tax=Kordiimonas sediminis TaxID=1735581 RepID=A0A919EAW6_9PROT|nr:hypothetical protein GCM10017044_28580 [Kordiimonas sediminis]
MSRLSRMKKKRNEEKHGDPDYVEPASEDYAKWKAKQVEKAKGKDGRRKVHYDKKAGEGDRTKQQVQDAKQNVLTITAVRNTSRTDGTYNLTVADFHTYFVGELNVLVHNCKKLKAKERRAQEKQRSQDAKGGDMQARGTRGNNRPE